MIYALLLQLFSSLFQAQLLVAKPTLQLSDSYEHLKSEFESLYQSGRRLKHRVYWSENKQSYIASTGAGELEISPKFLSHLRQHIESALERGYSDFIFYSDMGHGHLLWPDHEEAISLQTALKSNQLKVLYHTAELLKMRKGSALNGPLPPRSWLGWRYFSRNILAENKSDGSLNILFAKSSTYNTVRKVQGYHEVGTFLISASKEGCFAFKHGEKFYRFDLSFRR